MVIAGYDQEPYVHIVTAEKLFADVQHSGAKITDIKVMSCGACTDIASASTQMPHLLSTANSMNGKESTAAVVVLPPQSNHGQKGAPGPSRTSTPNTLSKPLVPPAIPEITNAQGTQIVS